MTIRKWFAAGALSVLMAVPAGAFDIHAMTPEEKTAFGLAVRDYLMENPEVLREWITALQDSEAAAEANRDQTLVSENAEAIFDDGYSWIGGNPDGDVTLVEFLDYRCSFCKRAHPEVKELISSDGNIRKIVKEFPILGEESVLASHFAIAVKMVAGDDAYGKMVDTLMEHRGAFTKEALGRLADDAGLDSDAILAKMDDPAVKEIIEKNYALAQKLAIGGTPTFIMGDQMIRGYLPLGGMRATVEQVRTEG